MPSRATKRDADADIAALVGVLRAEPDKVFECVQLRIRTDVPKSIIRGLALLHPMLVLETTEAALELARGLLHAGALPTKAADDALHIAIAASKAIPFLLTWNCRHLANAAMRPVIEEVCSTNGFKAPIICTPEELLGAKP